MNLATRLLLVAACCAACLFATSSAQGVPTELVHRYSFSETTGTTVSDSIGSAHGTVVNFNGANPAAWTGTQLALNNDGSQSSNSNNGNYVDLPNGMISALGNNATFEFWTTWYGPGNSNWQRVFDFGTSDGGEDVSPGAGNSSYIFATPRNSQSAVSRFGYRYGPTADERVIDGPGLLAQGVEKHLAVVWDGDAGEVHIYEDGLEVNSNTLHMSLSDLNDNNNWLGRAQWADPMYTGSYNDVRIYNDALTPEQLLASRRAGPDALYDEYVPQPLPALPVHRYCFDGDASDSIGGADGTAYGGVDFASQPGQAVLPNTGQGSNDNAPTPPEPAPGAYIDLPNGMISALGQGGANNNATFEVWTTWTEVDNPDWQRIFDFGDSNGGENYSPEAPDKSYIFLSPKGAGTLRFGYQMSPPRQELVLNGAAPLTKNVEKHLVVVWDGDNSEVRLYEDGVHIDAGSLFMSTHGVDMQLADLNDVNNWLGRAQWPDELLSGNYNEFRIYDYALSLSEVLGNFEAGPDTLNLVPEPSSLALVLLGLIGVALRRRRS